MIVPASALPPATPFTAHVNVAVLLSLAFAVNACVAPPCSDTVTGLTVTPLLCGAGWFGSVPPVLFPLPNPAHPAATIATPASAAIQMRLTACPQVDSTVFLSPRPESCRESSNRWIKLLRD